MKIRTLHLILVISIFAVVGCSRKPQRDHSEPVDGPHAGLFRCVNLVGRVIVKVDGAPNAEVVFDGDSFQPAVESLRLLKESIAIGCGGGVDRTNLSLVGYFTGAKVKPSVKHNAPEPEKSVFRLLGWQIKTPFFEYVHTPEGEPAPPPKQRNELLESDFDSASKPIVRRSEADGTHYGVGQIDPDSRRPLHTEK